MKKGISFVLLLTMTLFSLYILRDAINNNSHIVRLVLAAGGFTGFAFLLVVFIRRNLLANKS